MLIRILFFISALFWTSFSLASLNVSFDTFYDKFFEQLKPYQNEMGISIPQKSDLTPSLNENTQHYIYQIDFHSTLILIIETDLDKNMTGVISIFAMDPNDQMGQIRAIGLYGVLMGIFSPELGDERGTITATLLQEVASSGKAAENVQGKIKYSLIPGEFLTFTVGPAQ